MDRSSESKSEETPQFFTPLACLRLLSERGYVFDIEVSEMADEDNSDFRDHRWRVEIWEAREAKIKGTGEAPRKALAKHGALIDLMNQLSQLWADEQIPLCKIPVGVRISPGILTALASFCEKADLPSPKFSSDLIHANGSEKFKTIITVGDSSFSALSYEPRYSKLHAALKAYRELSGKPFHLDNVHIGDDCLSTEEFTLVECEQTHVVTAKCRIESDPSEMYLSKKRSHAEVSLDCPLPPCLMKIRKGMIEKAREDCWLDSRSTSRLSLSSRANSEIPPITITTNNNKAGGSPFSGVNVKMEGNTQVFSTWSSSSSSLTSPTNNNNKSTPTQELVDDSLLSFTPSAGRIKKTPMRRLPDNSQGSLGLFETVSSQVGNDIGNLTKETWSKMKLEVLRNMKTLEEISDSEDEGLENGLFKSTLIVTGLGFNEHLFLADYKCGLSLQAAVQDSVDILQQLG